MNIQLRDYLTTLDFKNPSCVLAKHGTSYKSIFKYLNRKLADYLNQNIKEIKEFREQHLNSVIRSIYSLDVGVLIQGNHLQRYISAKSLSVLIHIFLTDKDNYVDMFEECPNEDLIVMFLYWSIIKAKVSLQQMTTPGFRGVDWIKETEDTISLAFIKVMSEEKTRVVTQQKSTLQTKPTNRDEFPTLNPEIASASNQKTLQELMKEGRNKRDGFIPQKKIYNKKKNAPAKQPVPVHQLKQQPKVVHRVEVTAAKYHNSSDEEIRTVISEIPVQPSKKSVTNQVKKAEDIWPKLVEQVPKPLMKDEPPLLHKLLPSEPVVQKRKKSEDEEHFPTLGGGAGPTLQEIMKQQADAKKNMEKEKEKASKKKKKNNDRDIGQTKSIVQLAKESAKDDKNKDGIKEDFPSLPITDIKQQPITRTTFDEPVSASYNKKPKVKEVTLGVKQFEDARDFDDYIPSKAQDKSKQKKKNADDEDFPIFEPLIPEPAPASQLKITSKYEIQKNAMLNYLDHLDPHDTKIDQYGRPVPKQFKAPTSKKFEDLLDEDNDGSNKHSNTKQKQNSSKPDKNKMAADNYVRTVNNIDNFGDFEEDFPSFGITPAKPQANYTVGGIRQLVVDSSDLNIIKKQPKKK